MYEEEEWTFTYNRHARMGLSRIHTYWHVHIRVHRGETEIEKWFASSCLLRRLKAARGTAGAAVTRGKERKRKRKKKAGGEKKSKTENTGDKERKRNERKGDGRQ